MIISRLLIHHIFSQNISVKNIIDSRMFRMLVWLSQSLCFLSFSSKVIQSAQIYVKKLIEFLIKSFSVVVSGCLERDSLPDCWCQLYWMGMGGSACLVFNWRMSSGQASKIEKSPKVQSNLDISKLWWLFSQVRITRSAN